MEAIDSSIIDRIMESCEAWFDKKFNSKAVLTELFNHTVKTVRNYPSKMSIRLKFQNGTPNFAIFDKQRREIEFSDPSELADHIPRKTSARFLLVSSSIWYIGGRCVITWDCLQMQICDTPIIANVRQYMFVDTHETSSVTGKRERSDETYGEDYGSEDGDAC
jgi:hypothetical protein